MFNLDNKNVFKYSKTTLNSLLLMTLILFVLFFSVGTFKMIEYINELLISYSFVTTKII
jgi:hypothetical protein